MNILKKKAFDLYERTIAKEATVIGIRIWEPGNIYEIDVHIPDVDVAKWKQVQHMKCRVGDYIYRDYTPAGWNLTHRTCTLYIEVGHDGPGSGWTRTLKIGDTFLFSVDNVGRIPTESGKFLCLTDASGIGHYLALMQLSANEHPSDAVVFLNGNYELPKSLLQSGIQFLMVKGGDFQDEMLEWCWQNKLYQYEFIYMIGQNPVVKTLCKTLKSNEELYASKLYDIAFWS